MDVTLSCLTSLYETEPLGRALEGIASAGFKSVALGPSHEGKAVLDPSAGPEGAGTLKAEIERRGLSVRVLRTDLAPLGEASSGVLLDLLEGAGALGAAQLWISGPPAFDDDGEPRADGDWAGDLEAFVEQLEPLVERAAGAGLSILLPTEPRVSGCAAEVETFFSTDGVPAGLGLAYSPGLVSYFTGANPLRDIRSVLPRVKTLCVRDHRGAVGEQNFPMPGGGDIDFIALFDILRGANFSGEVVLEHVPGESPEEMDKSLNKAFKFLEMLTRG